MNKNIWISGFLVAALISAVVVIVLQTQIVKKRDVLPYVFRQDFMVGCTEEDETSWDYCKCTLDYLEKNYTNEEVMKMSIEVETTSKIPDEIMKAAGDCIHYLQ